MTLNPSDNLPIDATNVTSGHIAGSRLSKGLKPQSESAQPEVPQRFNERPGDEVDIKLVNQTKSQIRALVQEIAELAKSDCSVEAFYEGFLTRTISALASIGGAIWIRDSKDAPLKLHYQVNLKQTELANDQSAQASHSQLLNKLASQGEPTVVGPNSGSTNESNQNAGGNPTPYLLVVGPLKIDNETVGLVEIFQRPGAGPNTHRGYLRFLNQMCDIASDFLRNQKIRSFSQQQQMWQQLEQFMRLVHQGLDTEQTVFTLANEGRRLLDCDRVSVAIGKGRGCRVKAVSGLDSIERRSEQVRKLGSLAATVIRAGQPVWYTGEEELPPQIEKKIHAYVDKSHTRMLSIIPLFESQTDHQDQKAQPSRKPLGALIVEQLKDARVTPALRNRAKIVVEHGETALTNAQEHNSIFLMPVWKTIGKCTSAFRSGNRGKTFLALAALAGIMAFLALFPYEFGLGAKGSLIPKTQFEIFAKANGTIEELMVSDDGETVVEKDQLLAVMNNTDIELAISDLTGRISTEQVKIDNNQELQNNVDGQLTVLEQAKIAIDLSQAQQMKRSLEDELSIRLEEKALLKIKSPARGRVVNWNLRQSLLRRPVHEGQKLMTIEPPDTEWLIELEMPERRMKHLIEAERASDEPLVVTFGLLSNPGTEYKGELLQIDKKLDVYSDEGNTALVRVKFPNDSIDPELLRSETRVTAKVQCGTRSIGYVIFHELFETVQSSFMLWF